MEIDTLPKKREAPSSGQYDILVISSLSDQDSFTEDPEIILPINNILPKIHNKGPNIVFFKVSHFVDHFSKEAKRKGSIICRGNSYLNPPTLKEMISMVEPTLQHLRPLLTKVKESQDHLMKLRNSVEIIEQSVLENSKENKKQLNILKTNCGQDILKIHRRLMEAFGCLAAPRTEERNIEKSYENCVVLMLFFLNYFFFTHLNLRNIFKYFHFLNLVSTPKKISRLMKDFEYMSPVVKIMVLDCWLQLFYISDQFNNPGEVLAYLFSLSSGTRVDKLSSETSDVFFNILNSKIIKAYYKPVDESRHSQIILQIIREVHCLELPHSFHGLTTFGRYILISSTKTMNVSSSSLIRAYQLLVVLHESAHFMMRDDLGTDKEWIEFLTPNKGRKKPEAGRYLEEGIFGYIPAEITVKGAEFLLNISNWELKQKFFRRGFTINNKLETSGRNTPTDHGHISLMRFNDSSYIALGQCAKEFGRCLEK